MYKRQATPKPSAFEDLDFNFGERWIPTGIYDSYASWLFETEVKIGYIADLEDVYKRQVLRAYSGFGAIKEVLEPLPHKQESALTPLIEELHAVLKENTGGEREYNRYLDGLQAPILT